MSPLLPLAILLGGAGLLALTALPRFPFAAPLSITTGVLTLLALAALVAALPARAVLSDWTSTDLLPVGLSLRMDGPAWLLGLGMGLLLLAAQLTGLARPGGPRIPARVSMLLLTFAGLAALFAENIITLLMAWAGLDFIYFLTLILLARGEGVQPQAVLHLSFNSLGTLCLLALALVVGRSSVDYTFASVVTDETTTLLLTLAAVFRLGLFPLHLGLPLDVSVRQGLGTLLRLIPATVALDAIGRLAALGFAEPSRPWLILFGVIAVVIGAAQLWNTSDLRQGLASVIIAQSGLALLAGLWGGDQGGAAVLAVALAVLLGGGLLSLSHGFDAQRRWLTALPAFGVATLLGLPLTVGFIGTHTLYSLAPPNLIIVLFVIVIAQAVLGAGLLRQLVWPAEPLEGGTPALAAYVTGLGVLALTSLGMGLLALPLGLPVPDWLPANAELNWLAVGLLVLSGALAGLIWRYESRLRAPAESTTALVFRFVRLDWLYRAVWWLIQYLSRALETLAGVLEGEGAVLWALVVALAVVLLFR